MVTWQILSFLLGLGLTEAFSSFWKVFRPNKKWFGCRWSLSLLRGQSQVEVKLIGNFYRNCQTLPELLPHSPIQVSWEWIARASSPVWQRQNPTSKSWYRKTIFKSLFLKMHFKKASHISIPCSPCIWFAKVHYAKGPGHPRSDTEQVKSVLKFWRKVIKKEYLWSNLEMKEVEAHLIRWYMRFGKCHYYTTL